MVSSVRHHPLRFRYLLVVAVLACLHTILAALAWSDKCSTYDEVAHITSGYSYWLFNDYRLNPENGNLAQRWEALPLLSMELDFPSTGSPHWRASDVWTLADVFLYRLGNPYDRMLRWSRLMVAIASGVLAVFVFAWSRKLFGLAGGFLSLVLYVFSPTMLAHGGIATSDLFAAAFFLFSGTTLWILLHRATWWTLSLSCLCIAGLALSKTSFVLMVPAAGMMVGFRLWWGGPWKTCWWSLRTVRRRTAMSATIVGLGVLHTVFVVIMVWASTGFRFSPYTHAVVGGESYYKPFDQQLSGSGIAEPVLRWALKHEFLPEAFLYGTAFVLNHSHQRQAFLAGDYSLTGWPSFFPFAFLAKTPVGTLTLVFMLVVGLLRRRPRSALIYRSAPLWAVAIIYVATTLTSNLNIGHRHLLPLYPLLFIACGSFGRLLSHRNHKWLATAVICATVLSVGETAYRWPHVLSFFNVLVGGPSSGYRLLVDSSLDWGQDLPGLKRWLDAHGRAGQEGGPVYLSYFGTGSPGYYGIEATGLPFAEEQGRMSIDLRDLRPGTYCISATNLQQVYQLAFGRWNVQWEGAYQQTRRIVDVYKHAPDEEAKKAIADRLGAQQLNDIFRTYVQLRFGRLCLALRQREPDDNVGYSILIYKVDQEELTQALDGPPAELFDTAMIRGEAVNPQAPQ